MSTSDSNTAVQFVANFPPNSAIGAEFGVSNGHTTDKHHESIQPPSKRRGRPRGKYKPRLATNIKVALEEVVAKSISARRWMGLILDWIEEERATTKADIEALVAIAPITAIAHGMYQDRLIRLGELDHHMARLAIEVTAIETELREALETSRTAGSKETA